MAAAPRPHAITGSRSRNAAQGDRQMTDPIVTVRGLKKKFGGTEILHGLDFDIPPGRIYGLVGHNGAGKTTTLNAMLGLTSYSGSVRVLGLDPYRRRARLM